jgi:hypothetical protein
MLYYITNCLAIVLVQYLSDTSFLSLRGAIATKQSLNEVPQSNYSRLQLRNEIATPSARNDTEGYYPMLQTYKVSPVYLN